MFDWQPIVVLFLVAAAALYVGRVVWKSMLDSTGGGCGTCNSCDSKGEAPVQVLVELDDGQADERA